jgi:hypothetical protein
MAVLTQARAVALSERRDLVSQMGRFLDARLRRSGILYSGGGQGVVTPITVERGRGDQGLAVFELMRTSDRGLEIYALDSAGGRLRGTLRLLIGAGATPGMQEIPITMSFGEVPAGSQLAIAYVGSDCGCGPQTLRGRYFAMDPDVSRLP